MYIKREYRSTDGKALVSAGCFFCVVDDNIVHVLPAFLYLKQFDTFAIYTFVSTNTIVVVKDEKNVQFHRKYIELFNTNLQTAAKTVEFNRIQIKKLLKLSRLYLNGCNTSKKIDKYVELWNDNLNHEYPVFVKSPMSSGKNEDNNSLKIMSKQQLLERMSKIKSWALEYEQFLSTADKDTFTFYISPWVHITEEYRIFVYERRIITVCPQQYWRVDCHHTINEIDIHLLQSEFVDTYHHDNYCIDVYRDEHTKKFVIIETNEWYNSGPGLFDYCEFYTIPRDVVVFRTQK